MGQPDRCANRKIASLPILPIIQECRGAMNRPLHFTQKEDYQMKTPFAHCTRIITLTLLLALVLIGCGSQSSGSSGSSVPLRLGYFPNLTHAVAIVGVARGTFKNAFGPNVDFQTKTFNAGPALVEALFANDID